MPFPPTRKSVCPALFFRLAHTHIHTHTHVLPTAGQAMIGWGCMAASPGVLTLSVPCCHHCLENDNRMDGGEGEGMREINKVDNLCEKGKGKVRGGGWRWMGKL